MIRGQWSSLGRISALVVGLAMLAGCGGSSNPGGFSPPPPTPTANTVDVAVNSGPAFNAFNVAYVSVTVCNPGGTTTCTTIPDVQVDTGTSGLRLLASAPGLSGLALTPVTGSGSSVYECFEYADGNYLWGSVQQADVSMAGENATHVPIQVITSGSAPSNTTCGKASGNNLDSTVLLQANGILGIGTAQQDCGALCTGGTVLPYYWLCSSASSCTSAAAVPTATQVSNPVIFFAGDNNGIVLTMSQVAATGATSASGTLKFGIGTQTDNALSSSAKPYALSATALGPLSYNTILAAYPAGGKTSYPVFVESGQGLNYFLDAATVSAAPAGAGIANCPAPDAGLYCPIAVISLPFTIKDSGGDSAASSLSIGNGVSLLSSSVSQGGSNTAFSNLTGGASTMSVANDYVVLGMPFFYGQTVYVGIAGKAPPTGVPASDAALGYVAF